jgi:hypothetical protein
MDLRCGCPDRPAQIVCSQVMRVSVGLPCFTTRAGAQTAPAGFAAGRLLLTDVNAQILQAATPPLGPAPPTAIVDLDMSFTQLGDAGVRALLLPSTSARWAPSGGAQRQRCSSLRRLVLAAPVHNITLTGRFTDACLAACRAARPDVTVLLVAA